MEISEIRIIVYANNNIFDNLIVAPSHISSCSKDYARPDSAKNELKYVCFKLNRRGLNSYLVSKYAYTMKRSSYYRQSSLNMWREYYKSKVHENSLFVIYIKLRMPKVQYLDYKWNERITQMALERRELDHAMSWLSTLGGGFSALGETFEHCAEMAGKISVRQLQLALRLGDALLVARCKLWAALSLLQRGYLRVSKNIVRETYRLSIDKKDIRLQNMCKGVWAKLQYTYKVKRQLRKP
ncbi:uncharacterized protein F58A4.6 isoform X1 [Neodiprion fabricii]|uniref:uncharacterized protein F58A4.6 isoform X1 n=1 Tax=Neodiprion fabricii TaxID=2872261 RepID=UPI001ED949D8|nr:uncharacterized protein F58A4.6 isoform X1 [Neodiprion fabricii]